MSHVNSRPSGIHLSEELDDYKHKSLYIKLAKTVHRSLLEKALSFAVDSNAKNKGALFMWKLKELREQEAKMKSTVAGRISATDSVLK